MAKPRIFISSTCYDLSAIRNQLCHHLNNLGMEAVASDDKQFGVTPGAHSHHACLDEVDRADYLVLIIGGRLGGMFIGSEKSITNEEYKRAARKRIPILAFVRKDVQNLLGVYKKNPKGDFSGVVDDVRIFDFIELVSTASESNWIWPFENGTEICSILTVQFAHVVKLYSERLVADKTPKASEGPVLGAFVAFPGRLTQLPEKFQDKDAMEAWLTRGLRIVHSVISSIVSSTASAKEEKLKVLWLLGRYGKLEHGHMRRSMGNDEFKQLAWSTTRGKRVFNQLKLFGVEGWYDTEGSGYEGDYHQTVNIKFANDDDGAAADALGVYVSTLVERYGEDPGLAIFHKADMTVFS